MKSIGTKLAITFIGIFLLVVTIISSILIFISITTTKDLTLSGAEYRIELQAQDVQRALSERAIVIESVAEIIIGMDTLNPDAIQELISPIYESHEEYNLYVGFSDNRAIFADYWEPDSSWVATERDWYIDGVNNPNKIFSTVPYVDADSGEICFTLVYGMEKDGKIIGVLALDILQDALFSIMQAPKHVVQGQYSILVDNAGDIYYHPDTQYAPSKDGMLNLKQIDGNRFAPIFDVGNKEIYSLIENLNGQKCYYIPVAVEGTDWIVCGAILASEIEKTMVQQILITLLVSGVSLLIAIFVILYLSRKIITLPIKHMVEEAETMATGDLNVAINTESNDELGELGRAFQSIINETKASAGTVQAVANGDLTQTAHIRSDKDVMGLSLSNMLDKNNAVMSEILSASRMVASCSSQIADISQSLAAGSSEQTVEIERLSENISQVADLTHQNMKQSLETSRLGDEIINAAKHGGEQMTDMLSAVKAIDEASRSIGNVIKTIDDIAFQTNILALNAAVEAARAGQHGKGFAVVAEEVRNLATKSAEAAKNTGALISNSIEKAEYGSRLAGETAVSFEEIVSKLNVSVEKIKEISDYSEKQVDAIKIIDEELQSVSRVAQQNSASAEETAAAAEEMSGQSAMLEKSVSQFTLRDNKTSNRSVSSAPAIDYH